MYRASSPIFDVPEFPTLRRVKPLPKRRRTLLDTAPPEDVDDPPPAAVAVAGPEASADELIAHADTLSAQMALQSYYMPILGGVQELFKNDQDSGGATPVDLSGMGYGGGHDEDSGDGDYIDHLQQPGNTKKRKVPANMSGAAHGHDTSSTSGGEDEIADRAIPTGRTDSEYDSMGTQALNVSSGGTGQRRGKLSRATLAGLQHKDMLKSRKRQLAVVLGMGDGTMHPDSVRVRFSRRTGPRLARAYQALRRTLTLPENQQPFPETDFAFVFHSATSDRLVATKEEVVALHARFEAEFARQTARAVEANKQAAAVQNSLPGGKRADGTKQRRASAGKGAEQKAAVVEPPVLGTPARTGKKKKRSALANASNPHHLRNYVPSRLPHTGQLSNAQALANAQNLINPLPLRFLEAEIPSRRRSKAERNVGLGGTNLVKPEEEWICPFCEYDLFFGDEGALQRATRSRKKILRRRRRARERAAAAASGTGSAAAKNTSNAAPVDADGQPAQEAPHDDGGAVAGGKQTRLRDERDRGGAGLAGTGTGTGAHTYG